MPKYDLKKLQGEKTIALTYFGELDTRVLVRDPEGKHVNVKIDVTKGQVVEFTYTQATEMLSHYSHLWATEGEEPAVKDYLVARAARAKKAGKVKKAQEKNPELITDADIDSYGGGAIRAKLKSLRVTFNEGADKEELRELLREKAAEAIAAEAGEGEDADLSVEGRIGSAKTKAELSVLFEELGVEGFDVKAKMADLKEVLLASLETTPEEDDGEGEGEDEESTEENEGEKTE